MRENDDAIPSILQPVEDPDLGGDGSSKEYRRNWARLIQKIYETDPLCCPKCQGRMKVISVIEQHEIIKKILKHLGLWEVNNVQLDTRDSQVPPCEDYLFHDPEYPVEAYI